MYRLYGLEKSNSSRETFKQAAYIGGLFIYSCPSTCHDIFSLRLRYYRLR